MKRKAYNELHSPVAKRARATSATQVVARLMVAYLSVSGVVMLFRSARAAIRHCWFPSPLSRPAAATRGLVVPFTCALTDWPTPPLLYLLACSTRAGGMYARGSLSPFYLGHCVESEFGIVNFRLAPLTCCAVRWLHCICWIIGCTF